MNVDAQTLTLVGWLAARRPEAINVDVDVRALMGLAGWTAALSAIVAGFLWARWLRRRAVAPRFAAWTAYALLAFAAFTPVASCTTAFVTLGLIASGIVDPTNGGGLGTVSVGPFTKPTRLAAVAAILLAMLVLIGATARWHWFPRSVVPKNDPPYR
jgi:hypothetical protein